MWFDWYIVYWLPCFVLPVFWGFWFEFFIILCIWILFLTEGGDCEFWMLYMFWLTICACMFPVPIWLLWMLYLLPREAVLPGFELMLPTRLFELLVCCAMSFTPDLDCMLFEGTFFSLLMLMALPLWLPLLRPLPFAPVPRFLMLIF